MDFSYQRACRNDLELLVKTRVEMLRAVNGTATDEDFCKVAKSCRDYYLESFEKDIHVAYLAFSGEEFAGCGGISFFKVMPNCSNPSGRKAYIMNIYTVPKYRGQGLATKIVDLLVQEAYTRGIHDISLKATDMGQPVYERYGFVKDKEAMILKAESGQR